MFEDKYPFWDELEQHEWSYKVSMEKGVGCPHPDLTKSGSDLSAMIADLSLFIASRSHRLRRIDNDQSYNFNEMFAFMRLLDIIKHKALSFLTPSERLLVDAGCTDDSFEEWVILHAKNEKDYLDRGLLAVDEWAESRLESLKEVKERLAQAQRARDLNDPS